MKFTNKIFLTSAIFVCGIFSVSDALANNGFKLEELDEGEAILYLNAKDSKKVQQDLLVASLTFTQEGEDKRLIQNNLNKAMKLALMLAKQETKVLHYTEGYQVYIIHQNYRDKQKKYPTKWRAQQTITLESKNSDSLLELARKMQDQGLHMNNLSYRLSSEKYEQVSDSLMEGALQKLQARAQKAANALNKNNAELINININNHNSPRHYSRSNKMVMMSDVSAAESMEVPSVAPGQTEVVMNVNATALLSEE